MLPDFFSMRWRLILGSKEIKILTVGLHAAGKKTILYRLKMGKDNKTPEIPSITSHNVANFDYGGLRIPLWDLDGQDKLRILWQEYCQNSDGLIFVVDSNDRSRIETAAKELKKILAEEELKANPVLVLANKQDLNGAMSPHEITEKMEMSQLKERLWLVQGTSAITCQGLKEGIDWMAKAIFP